MNKNRQAAVLPLFFASLTRAAVAAVPGRQSAAGAAVLAAALMLLRGAAMGQVVTTLAGSGAAGSADGAGPAASFFTPEGAAVDQAGNVYVADTSNARIRKIAPGGDVTTLANLCCGRVYGGAVIAVAVDAAGSVYAADPIGDGIDGGALYKVSPGGAVTYPDLPYDSPAGVAIDAYGNVYLMDLYDGLLKGTASGASVLAKDVKGSGIAVDQSGIVYVADTDHARILRVTPDGVVTTLAGSGSPGDVNGRGTAASFRGPTGVAVDCLGNVYVADRDNNKIRQIGPDGEVTTLAGSGSPGFADGTGTTASFRSPSGVAVDCSGNLYVADTYNNRIRKITVSAGGGGRNCTADAFTACLVGGRYKVTSHWRNQYAGGQVSTLSATRLTDATAAFWLTDVNTYEYLIRINTATDNGRAWIAIPTFTDVEFWIEVTDTTRGQYYEYHSLPGNRTLIYDPDFFVYP
jgi:serine/threonine-protein kinase